MKGLEKKNTIAKVLLIIGAVYVLIGIIATIVGYHRLFDGLNLLEYVKYLGEYYSGTYVLIYTSMFFFRLIIDYMFFGLWVMWIIVIVTGVRSIRVPMIITFAYYAVSLAYTLFTVFINHESLFDLIRRCGVPALIFTAWLMLVIGTDNTNRLVFAILRWIAAALGIIGNIRLEMTYIRAVFHGSMYFLPNIFFVFAEIVADLVVAAFVLWILKPELFDKNI